MANLFSVTVSSISSVISLIPTTVEGAVSITKATVGGTVDIAKSTIDYGKTNISKGAEMLGNVIDRNYLSSLERKEDLYYETFYEDLVNLQENLAKSLNKLPEDERPEIINEFPLLKMQDKVIVVDYKKVVLQVREEVKKALNLPSTPTTTNNSIIIKP